MTRIELARLRASRAKRALAAASVAGFLVTMLARRRRIRRPWCRRMSRELHRSHEMDVDVAVYGADARQVAAVERLFAEWACSRAASSAVARSRPRRRARLTAWCGS
jgi:hypothetical protein